MRAMSPMSTLCQNQYITSLQPPYLYHRGPTDLPLAPRVPLLLNLSFSPSHPHQPPLFAFFLRESPCSIDRRSRLQTRTNDHFLFNTFRKSFINTSSVQSGGPTDLSLHPLLPLSLVDPLFTFVPLSHPHHSSRSALFLRNCPCIIDRRSMV